MITWVNLCNIRRAAIPLLKCGINRKLRPFWEQLFPYSMKQALVPVFPKIKQFICSVLNSP